MTFVADTMMGKLSRWLRILGYDTVYDPEMTLEQLADAAGKTDSIFLTRRTHLPSDVQFGNLLFIPHEIFEDQLRFIVERFNLNTGVPLFTRCLKCNVPVIRIPRDELAGRVPLRTIEGTKEFYACPRCNNIYWNGTHYKNTLKKLENIFKPVR